MVSTVGSTKGTDLDLDRVFALAFLERGEGGSSGAVRTFLDGLAGCGSCSLSDAAGGLDWASKHGGRLAFGRGRLGGGRF